MIIILYYHYTCINNCNPVTNLVNYMTTINIIYFINQRKVNTSPELSSNDKIETINPEKRTNSNDEIPLITIKRKKTKNSNDSSSAKPIPTENILLSMKNVESLLRNRPCLKCKQANLLPTVSRLLRVYYSRSRPKCFSLV